MNRLILLTVVALALTGCDNNSNASKDKQKPVAEIALDTPQIDHYYSLKDGSEYGYEQAVSLDSANAGQAAPTLIMFKYAGEKSGVYQAYMKEDTGAVTSLECNNPCEFIKINVFFDGQHIKTERIKATEGTIGWLVMADAINGKLEQHIAIHKKTGEKAHVWFTEQDGMLITPI